MKKKDILKEIIIILLLILAIILIMGILLYDYAPNNKIIPQQVSYTTPEKVDKELEENKDMNELNIEPYTITAEDLTNYKKTKDYVSGKKNPFESINSQNKTGNTTSGNTVASETTENSSSGTINTNGTTNTTTDDTQEGYLPDKGTK